MIAKLMQTVFGWGSLLHVGRLALGLGLHRTAHDRIGRRPTPAGCSRVLPVVLWALLPLAGQIDSACATPAATIYRQKCASCHGAMGGGVPDHHEGPLYGDASVAELAEQIAETMPEDDPEACTGDEARQVAQYIFGEFYSPEARRAKGWLVTPRIELARLTVQQYRNSVADLIAAFTPPPQVKRSYEQAGERQRGLRAEYFQSKGMNKKDQRKLERIDRSIDFDFAAGSPADGITPDQFTVIWQGSLLAPCTGYYDFRIHTGNGARLYLNVDAVTRHAKLRDDSSNAIESRLIDGWVSSGEMRALGGRMFLLGGRRYPIRVEFFKYKEPTASLRLEWKPPHGVWATIDDRVLRPAPAARTFVIDTPFPADDRSIGYERGSSVSQEWHTAVASGALATAHEVIERLALLSGVSNPQRNRLKLADFLVQFASIAFRRPLSSAEVKLYRETLFDHTTPESAVRQAVLLVLTSPHFLYTDLTPVDASPSEHAVAARLAFALWDSLPDAELRRVAGLGRLSTRAQVEAQADRMLDDPRARTKMQAFFRHWLELEELDLAKDMQIYPEFDEAVIADLRRSLELFVDQVVWSESSDYRELLQADYLLLNDRLQRLYGQPTGIESPVTLADSQFEPIVASEELRSGILTHPYLLSAFAYHNTTSPIHRGVFLTRNIIGRPLKPPPVAVAFENSEFAADLTMREKVTELTRDQACLACHEVINPLGFALENYDAVGRWRTTDNSKPILAESNYVSAAGATVRLGSARDIANFAITSPAAHRAFVTQLFQHLVRQSPLAYGPATVENLQRAFVADDFHIKKLLLRMATRAAIHDPVTAVQSEAIP